MFGDAPPPEAAEDYDGGEPEPEEETTPSSSLPPDPFSGSYSRGIPPGANVGKANGLALLLDTETYDYAYHHLASEGFKVHAGEYITVSTKHKYALMQPILDSVVPTYIQYQAGKGMILLICNSTTETGSPKSIHVFNHWNNSRWP